MLYDMREYLTPKRLTIAMWDFSWIFGHYPGGSFEDFDKCTDDLLERRFNTIRIDCLPWIVGNQKSMDEIITLPASPLETWGVSSIDYRHYVITELIELIGICKKKGIYIILSNWWIKCIEYNYQPSLIGVEKALNTLMKGWELVLGSIKANDLFDNILYVDFDQEFPFFSPTQDKLNDLCTSEKDRIVSVNAMENAGSRKNSQDLKWNIAQMDAVTEYFTSTIAHFQRLHPELRFTFSITEYWEEIRALKLSSFDVLELHFWMHNPRFENRTGFINLTKDRGNHNYSDYQLRLDKTLSSVRPMLMKEMENRLIYSQQWGNEIAAPVVTTEAWGPWWHMDHMDLKWEWLRDWCAECMSLAGHYGLWGVTPWNYSHPYWDNWKDIDWYRKVNGAFLNS